MLPVQQREKSAKHVSGRNTHLGFTISSHRAINLQCVWTMRKNRENRYAKVPFQQPFNTGSVNIFICTAKFLHFNRFQLDKAVSSVKITQIVFQYAGKLKI
ncbi:MAG: hypothetical protein ACD_39C00063G0002 [uncultured bacterium]|nr:MAG: hypothetical protein ACD_39C00063G0002 [uncultured bacterium]